MSASVNLPLHHKVQKFPSGTGSSGWSRKNGHKTVVVWWWSASIYKVVFVKLPGIHLCKTIPLSKYCYIETGDNYLQFLGSKHIPKDYSM